MAAFAAGCAAAPEAADSRSDILPEAEPTAEDLCQAGRAYNANGESDKAVAALRRCLQEKPNSARAHYQLGLALSRLKKPQAALDELEQAHRLDPRSRETALLLGMTYDLAGKTEKALEIYRQAVADHPGDAALLHEMGNSLMVLGRPAEAIAALEKAAAKDSSADLLGDLGYAYLVAAKHEKALSTLSRAAKLAPARADIALNLGRACLAAGKPDQAVLALEKLVKLAAPDDQRGWVLLALAYIRQAAFDKAKAAAERAIAINGDNPKAYFLLGVAQDAGGDKRAAHKSMLRALKLDPGLSAAKKWLAKNRAAKNRPGKNRPGKNRPGKRPRRKH